MYVCMKEKVGGRDGVRDGRTEGVVKVRWVIEGEP